MSVKIAVFAPIPSDSDRMTASENPGVLRRSRSA